MNIEVDLLSTDHLCLFSETFHVLKGKVVNTEGKGRVLTKDQHAWLSRIPLWSVKKSSPVFSEPMPLTNYRQLSGCDTVFPFILPMAVLLPSCLWRHNQFITRICEFSQVSSLIQLPPPPPEQNSNKEEKKCLKSVPQHWAGARSSARIWGQTSSSWLQVVADSYQINHTVKMPLHLQSNSPTEEYTSPLRDTGKIVFSRLILLEWSKI